MGDELMIVPANWEDIAYFFVDKTQKYSVLSLNEGFLHTDYTYYLILSDMHTHLFVF
jgi:hypothetical protein